MHKSTSAILATNELMTYVNWVANRHVIIIYMYVGQTRCTSTQLNINNQYAHDLFSVLHFIKENNK